tara:strand:+ start:3616 stop:3957 length:342 start_codon:yes stop_codon:yes gene_type:complete
MRTSKQRRAERRKALFQRQFHSDERVRFIRGLACDLTGKVCSIHNAHMKSRGAGGDYKTIVPLQFMAHKDFDEMPEEKFEAKYGRSKQSVRERAPLYQKIWEQHKRGDTNDRS